MKCPYCLNSFHEAWENSIYLTHSSIDGRWDARCCQCPECFKTIIQLFNSGTWRQIVPKGISRMPLPSEVDDTKIINDYNEACLVLVDSPKASAALSRRCLQHLLREKAGVKKSELSIEIQEVIDSNKLPSDLSENLDYVRNVGNFGVHPNKSKSSGEIVEVDTGEAEWNLSILEELIDYYFVRPARAKSKKAELNIKLKEAGKPELPL